MQAGQQACACPECGVVCEGLFDGCPDVWARGPRPVAFLAGTVPAGRAGALNAGPAPQPQRQQQPPPRRSPLANGFSGAPAPPLPPQPMAGSRADVLQWFEDAFDELRSELRVVVSAVTRQQAMLAELLDTREAELRVVMVAESLPELAGEAAAKALSDLSDGLAEVIEARLEDFRIATEASDLSAVGVMDGMRELLARIEVTAELGVEATSYDGAVRLEALKTSVARQLKPVAAAVAEVAAHVEDAQEREAARGRALRSSVTKQLQPLATALEAAIGRTDRQMAEIRARLDAVAGPAPTKPRPRRRATT